MAGPLVDNGTGTDYTPRARLVSGEYVQSFSQDAPNAVVGAIGQSASAVDLLAANANRQGFVIENDPQDALADLYVKFGSGASATDYTRKLRPGESWERLGGYTGLITGAWSAGGTGKARVTEEVL